MKNFLKFVKKIKNMKKHKIGPINVDSTPEFICEECGYHGDSCVCVAQKKIPVAPLTLVQSAMGAGVAQFSFPPA